MSTERKVRVLSGDKSKDLGIGVYLGVTTLRKEIKAGELDRPLEGLIELIADVPTPKIRLASGEIIYGCMCWWIDVEPTQS